MAHNFDPKSNRLPASDEVPEKRRSSLSILKAPKSPRIPLQDVTSFQPDADERRKSQLTRRVSFADTHQINEYSIEHSSENSPETCDSTTGTYASKIKFTNPADSAEITTSSKENLNFFTPQCLPCPLETSEETNIDQMEITYAAINANDANRISQPGVECLDQTIGDRMDMTCAPIISMQTEQGVESASFREQSLEETACDEMEMTCAVSSYACDDLSKQTKPKMKCVNSLNQKCDTFPKEDESNGQSILRKTVYYNNDEMDFTAHISASIVLESLSDDKAPSTQFSKTKYCNEDLEITDIFAAGTTTCANEINTVNECVGGTQTATIEPACISQENAPACEMGDFSMMELTAALIGIVVAANEHGESSAPSPVQQMRHPSNTDCGADNENSLNVQQNIGKDLACMSNANDLCNTAISKENQTFCNVLPNSAENAPIDPVELLQELLNSDELHQEIKRNLHDSNKRFFLPHDNGEDFNTHSADYEACVKNNKDANKKQDDICTGKNELCLEKAITSVPTDINPTSIRQGRHQSDADCFPLTTLVGNESDASTILPTISYQSDVTNVKDVSEKFVFPKLFHRSRAVSDGSTCSSSIRKRDDALGRYTFLSDAKRNIVQPGRLKENCPKLSESSFQNVKDDVFDLPVQNLPLEEYKPLETKVHSADSAKVDTDTAVYRNTDTAVYRNTDTVTAAASGDSIRPPAGLSRISSIKTKLQAQRVISDQLNNANAKKPVGRNNTSQNKVKLDRKTIKSIKNDLATVAPVKAQAIKQVQVGESTVEVEKQLVSVDRSMDVETLLQFYNKKSSPKNVRERGVERATLSHAQYEKFNTSSDAQFVPEIDIKRQNVTSGKKHFAVDIKGGSQASKTRNSCSKTTDFVLPEHTLKTTVQEKLGTDEPKDKSALSLESHSADNDRTRAEESININDCSTSLIKGDTVVNKATIYLPESEHKDDVSETCGKKVENGGGQCVEENLKVLGTCANIEDLTLDHSSFSSSVVFPRKDRENDAAQAKVNVEIIATNEGQHKHDLILDNDINVISKADFEVDQTSKCEINVANEIQQKTDLAPNNVVTKIVGESLCIENPIYEALEPQQEGLCQGEETGLLHKDKCLTSEDRQEHLVQNETSAVLHPSVESSFSKENACYKQQHKSNAQQPTSELLFQEKCNKERVLERVISTEIARDEPNCSAFNLSVISSLDLNLDIKHRGSNRQSLSDADYIIWLQKEDEHLYRTLLYRSIFHEEDRQSYWNIILMENSRIAFLFLKCIYLSVVLKDEPGTLEGSKKYNTITKNLSDIKIGIAKREHLTFLPSNCEVEREVAFKLVKLNLDLEELKRCYTTTEHLSEILLAVSNIAYRAHTFLQDMANLYAFCQPTIIHSDEKTEVTVEFFSLILDICFTLTFPINLRTYPYGAIKPKYQIVQSKDLNVEAFVIDAAMSEKMGTNYMRRMCDAVKRSLYVEAGKRKKPTDVYSKWCF